VIPEDPLNFGLAAGSAIGMFSFSHMATSYLVTYANTHLGYSRNVVLFVDVLGGLTIIAFLALSAALCDRVGRRRMMLVGWAACLPWSFVVIPLMDTGKPIFYALLRAGYLRHESHRLDWLRTSCSLPPRTVPHPLPLHRIGAGGKRRQCRWWRRATADRRSTAGNLRQLGDRSLAGHSYVGEPGVHVFTPGNHWNNASIHSRC
jgi:hypothetical protein